jgi:Tfp pilus assembly protein PilN
MKLRLNLSTRPLDNKRPFLAAAALLGFVGVVALALLSTFVYRSWRANRDLHLQISRAEADIRASQQAQAQLAVFFQTPQAQQVLDRAAFLNSLIGERSFPWTKVFMDLETSLPPGVRVISISPSLINDRAKINLTIGALSDDAELKFLKALEDSKVFSNVRVEKEVHPTQISASDHVQASLTLWYATL